MAKHNADRAREEILLSSDQTEQAILEYLHDRNFFVGGAKSVTLNWTTQDKKAPIVSVVIERDKGTK